MMLCTILKYINKILGNHLYIKGKNKFAYVVN